MERMGKTKDEFNVGYMSTAALVGALRNEFIVDMDEQACSEAMAGLDAYYKVR